MLDTAEDSMKLSRHFVCKGMQDLSTTTLINILSDDDPIVRSCAGLVLHLRGGDTETFRAIASLTTDSRTIVREVATFVLGQFGTPNYPFRQESIPLLIDLCDDPEDEVRGEAIAALAHLNAIEAKSKIMTLAIDRSPDIRSGVAHYMAILEPSRNVIDLLNKLSKDVDAEVRQAALWSLEDVHEIAFPIEDRRLAEKIESVVIDIRSRLEASLEEVRAKVSEEAILGYEAAITRVLNSLRDNITMPLRKQHPDIASPTGDQRQS